MAQTIVGTNNPATVKRWATMLQYEVGKESFFNRQMIATQGQTNAPIIRLKDLENQKGDTVYYSISINIRTAPIEGDAIAEGNGVSLQKSTESVKINQMRFVVDAGSTMSFKRTLGDLQEEAKTQLRNLWATTDDELFMMSLAGARGVNDGFNFPLNYTGFAGNTFTAPDAGHQLYGGLATSKASLTVTDLMTTGTIEKARTRCAQVIPGTGVMPMRPLKIDGQERYVMVMSPEQVHQLRTSSGASGWLEIQKSAATNLGKKSPIFENSLGMHAGIVLHEHSNVIKFNDYGASANVKAARALLLGAEAGVLAYGSSDKQNSFSWSERPYDHGDKLEIACSRIFGVKKNTFTINGATRDLGVIAIDTANPDPTV